MLSWINIFLDLAVGLVVAGYFLGGCYGAIKPSHRKGARLGGLILVATSIILYIILRYTLHLTGGDPFNAFVRYSIILILSIVGGVIAKRLPERIKFKTETEAFANQGTSRRERDVARSLGKMIPGKIVEAVRFAGSGGSIYVSVDLYGGRSIKGGYVDENMSTDEQVDSIYKYINAQLNI